MQRGFRSLLVVNRTFNFQSNFYLKTRYFNQPKFFPLNYHTSFKILNTEKPEEEKLKEQKNTEENDTTINSNEENSQQNTENSQTTENNKIKTPNPVLAFFQNNFTRQKIKEFINYNIETLKQWDTLTPHDPEEEARLAKLKEFTDSREKNTGIAVVGEADKTWFTRGFDKLKEKSKLVQTADDKIQQIKQSVEETDNPVIVRSKEIGSDVKEYATQVGEQWIGGSETSFAIKRMKEIYPQFDEQLFISEMKHSFLPKVIRDVVEGNMDEFKKISGERAYMTMMAPKEYYESNGQFFNNKFLGIDSVDLFEAKLLENDPVLMVLCRTEQTYCIKNKEGEILEGGDSNIKTCFFALVLAREIEERRWKVVDISEQGSHELL